MNQILSVDNGSKGKIKNKKVRNSGPVEINSIIKFFSIAILLFGIFMISSGSYSMYREMSLGKEKTKPVIYVEPIGETEIELSERSYSWNEENTVNVPCNGKKETNTKIEIPKGVNSLLVRAVDIEGQDIEYKKVYNIESNINIDIQPEGNNLKIALNGKNTLTYMTYRWDEEEETKIDINANEFEQTIEIPKGLHTLTVIAVDENNDTEELEQEINGVTKPKLEVTTDGVSNFIIKASDEKGIKEVQFIINETEGYVLHLDQVLPLEERKEFEYSYGLHPGENRLYVTVYNEDGISETFNALVNM